MADRVLKVTNPIMKGSDVKACQTLLLAHGIYDLEADAKFGKITAAKVKLFQGLRGLPVTGKVDAKTWSALRASPVTGSAHFKASEFRCRCGKCRGFMEGVPSGVRLETLVLLELIRDTVNKKYGNGKEYPLYVHSGYRCPAHNKAAGGAAKSQHMYARAVDISSPICTPYQLGLICDALDPRGGVGLGGLNIVHADTRPGKSRWWYTYKSWAAWKKRFNR